MSAKGLFWGSLGALAWTHAGYPLAIEAARRDGVRIPMLDSDNAKTS